MSNVTRFEDPRNPGTRIPTMVRCGPEDEFFNNRAERLQNPIRWHERETDRWLKAPQGGKK